MAKAAVAKPEKLEKKELVFWVAENHYDDGISDDVFFVSAVLQNEASFEGDIADALKFADEASVDRLMSGLSFAQYEAVEHSMMV